MQQHEKKCFCSSRFLQTHPNVEEVFYPGFKNHPGHLFAKKQMSGFGCLVSFKIKGGLDKANQFFKKHKVFQLADSLGGVELLANYSALMTHESYPPVLRLKIGVTDNFIRISVEIENVDDLIEDLNNALN
jgi:cystathionine beta-lyase/cystathionine gamma-synthase